MDTLFFVASKLVWAVIRPESWLLIALAIAVLSVSRRPDRARRVILAAIVGVLFIGVVPLGQFMLARIEERYPANPPLATVDGIILLGGSEETGPAAISGQPELNAAGERMAATAALALSHPQARIVVSGGSGALIPVAGQPDHAAIASGFLSDLGISADRLILETRSRNTAENAALSLPLAAPEEGETWVLVTSAWHMPRAMDSFARAGWPALVPWPVDYRGLRPASGLRWNFAENLLLLDVAAKELVGRLAYGLTGR